MPSEPKVNILLVDDHPENLLTLEAILSSLGENLIKASSGEEALRCLLHQDFAVILLDVQMPQMDGFETAALIRNRARSRQTPIIFLTAFSTNDDLIFKGYSLGAVDYLHKPIDPTILTSKVSVFVDLFRKTEVIKQQSEEVRRQATQLEAINAELRQSEERFRLLSACSPVGIFVTDTDGRCIYFNPRCQAICGFTLENSLDETWQVSVHPDDRDAMVANWVAYRQGGQEYSGEFRLQIPDSDTRWVHVRSSPMLSDQNQLLGHVGTIEDITERKQVEATRNQMIREQVARREAEASSRMKDEFLAVLSHELRTPLNAMLGWSRLLRTRKFDETTTARALETIERNATAQAQLIEDILDVSKIIRGKLQLNCAAVNPVSIIEAAIDSVRPQADAKSIELSANLAFAPSLIVGDPVRLQQIVWNLLTNAIKFTPTGGCVEIQFSVVDGNETNGSRDLEDTPRSPIRHLPRPYVQIRVIDTGTGISPEFLPNVFERFRQADSSTTRSHNGLGLGLAIVRHLVELHHGTVYAKSPGEGMGATFTVELPLSQQTANPMHCQKQPGMPETVSDYSLDGISILLVDDELDTREFITFVLQQHGATVTASASAVEALTLFKTLKPNLLISDIGMPEHDGYMLIRQMRSFEADLDNHIPAVALTAYSREEDHHKALAAGFDVHLSKPVEVSELLQTITQLLHCAAIKPSH
jgi:PAS domain S-box-containing protein